MRKTTLRLFIYHSANYTRMLREYREKQEDKIERLLKELNKFEEIMNTYYSINTQPNDLIYFCHKPSISNILQIDLKDELLIIE